MLQNAAKSGINEIGIGLRISGRTSTHTSDKRFDRRTEGKNHARTPLSGSFFSLLFWKHRSVLDLEIVRLIRLLGE